MAWTRIAGRHDEENSATTLTTGALDTRGANFLVALVYSYGEPTLDQDSYSNSNWQSLTAYGSSRFAKIFYCYNPSVGQSHTIRISADGSKIRVYFYAYSGMNTTSAVYVGSNGSASMTTGNITPSAVGDLVVSVGGNYYSNEYAAPTIVSGDGPRVDYVGDAPDYHYTAMSECSAASTSAQGVVWSGTSPVVPASAIAVFKAAAAPAGSWLTGNYWWDSQ